MKEPPLFPESQISVKQIWNNCKLKLATWWHY